VRPANIFFFSLGWLSCPKVAHLFCTLHVGTRADLGLLLCVLLHWFWNTSCLRRGRTIHANWPNGRHSFVHVQGCHCLKPGAGGRVCPRRCCRILVGRRRATSQRYTRALSFGPAASSSGGPSGFRSPTFSQAWSGIGIPRTAMCVRNVDVHVSCSSHVDAQCTMLPPPNFLMLLQHEWHQSYSIGTQWDKVAWTGAVPFILKDEMNKGIFENYVYHKLCLKKKSGCTCASLPCICERDSKYRDFGLGPLVKIRLLR